MRSPTRLSSFPPELALVLSPTRVRALLSRFGEVALDAEDPLSVAEALCFRSVPTPLAGALADAAPIATPVGREAILEAIGQGGANADAGPASSRALHRYSPIDLAVRIVCAEGLSKRRARAVLERALVRVARHLPPRPWYALLWPRRELPARPESILEAAREVHGDAFVKGWIASSEGGVLRVIVVYRAPAERVVRAIDNVVRARTVRPLACDTIRWDSRDGRVAFSLARPAMLTEWLEAIGRACAGDPHTFRDDPAYTLKSLHEKGAPWLAKIALPAGVMKIEVIACEIDDDGKLVRVRGGAALRRAHELVGMARGYMRSVTLRVTLEGGNSFDATIDLPWKVLLSGGLYEEELRLVMEALEMHAPGSLVDDVPSVAPVQPEWRWVDLLTKEGFARAQAAKTLIRVRGKRPSGREHRRWGSLLRAFKMAGEDAEYVASEEIAIRAFDAAPESLVWYALDWKRLAETLRAATALDEATASAAADVPPALLMIGELATPAARVAVFSLVRAVQHDEIVPLLKQLRQACGRATPAVIVPRGRSLGGAIAEVEVTPGEQLGVEDVAWIVGKIAEDCGLGDEVEPWRFATAAAPLVLSVKRGEAWYRRVQLLVTENQLAMFFALARATGHMKSTELGMKISPGAVIPDQTVRKARQILDERLRASFEAENVPMPEGLAENLVELDSRRGYRLGVGVIVR